MMNKKILHIQLFPLLSGVQRVSLDEFKYLNPMCEKYLIVKERGELSNEIEMIPNTKIFYVNDLVREMNFISDFKALFGIIKILIKVKPDVVHTHSSKPGVLGRIAARLTGVKTVVHTVHGFAFPGAKSKLSYYIFWFLEKISSYFMDKLIVLTNSDLYVAKDNLGIPLSKIELVPNAIDISLYRNETNNNVDFLDKDYFNIVMIGRLWEQKNPNIVLEALRVLKSSNRIDRVKFYFIGDGPLRKKLEENIVEYDLLDHVHLLGWRNDVNLILPNFDLFVLPSLWEGMPLSILEAFASEVPVLTSDIDGNKSLLEGEHGLMFESGSVDDLVAKLEFCISHDLSSYVNKAKGKVHHEHNWFSRVERLSSIYKIPKVS
ncbi:glycosyltransferase family 4 protein [Vibrio splendidus]